MARSVYILCSLVWLVAAPLRLEAQGPMDGVDSSAPLVAIDANAFADSADSGAVDGLAEVAPRGGSEAKSKAGQAVARSAISTFASQGIGLAMINMDNGLGATLVIGGLLVGPATGYFHGGHGLRGLGGVAIRASLMLGSALAVGAANSDEEFAVLGGFLLGFALAELEAIYEVLTVAGYIRSAETRSRPRLIFRAPGDGRPAQVGVRLSY